MRVILVTGKGGVGKTTIAAATGVQIAAMGHRVLVTSTDPAHSLGDVFDVELGQEPTSIGPCCWAQELSARAIAKDTWSRIGQYLQRVLNWLGVDDVQAEELAVVPGIDELLSLVDLKSSIASANYDVVVVDCAPSAETLRLLTFPHVLGLFATKAGLDGSAGRFLTRLLGSGLDLPSPDKRVLDAIGTLESDLASLQSVLSSARHTTARVVTTPEKVVVKEALRTYTYLSLFGYCVDALVVNQVFPANCGDGLAASLHSRQVAQLVEIDKAFGDLPRLLSPMVADEPVGIGRLTDLGSQIYDGDPSERLADGTPLTIFPRGPERVLKFPAPGHRAHQVELDRRGDEIHVRIGERERSLVLPDSLRHRQVVAAGLRAGSVEVVFGGVA